MRRGAILALAAGGLVAAGGLALALALGGARPADAPLPLAAGAPPPARIAILGTSLSHGESWPGALQDRLTACRADLGLGPAEVRTVAMPDASSEWGAERARELMAPGAGPAPDLVLIEFGGADADRRNGIGAQASLAAHGAILDALGDVPAGVLAMSPAHGPRGWVRIGRRGLEADLAALAAARGAGAFDLVPDWHARWDASAEPDVQRRIDIPDGLHPLPQVAADTIVLPLLFWIAPDCAS